ncbi:MAG: metallophosphoesterase [Deltaproteobacteria bacterium]|nr:metallophosphoesterase [Deltaproteobacteria bacterium]
MDKMNILWIDNEIDDREASIDMIVMKLENAGIEVTITPFDRATGAIEVMREKRPDLLLLDIDLGTEMKQKRRKIGYDVIDSMEREQFWIPTVILSNNVPSKGGKPGQTKKYESLTEQYKDKYLACFQLEEQVEEGFEDLVSFIREFISGPPIVLALFSDLHIGRIPKMMDERSSFQLIMEDEFKWLKRTHQPDYALITGDFVHTNHEKEYPHAKEFIETMRASLSLTDDRQLQFCPGNHDIILKESIGDSSGFGPWHFYHKFVKSLRGYSSSSIPPRFISYKERKKKLDPFKDQEDLLAIAKGTHRDLHFLAFNSVDPNNNGKPGRINSVQFQIARQELNDDNKPGGLKIGLLHHHLFPVQAENLDEEEERVITNQATAIRLFHNNSIKLVIHGHSHHSSIHNHHSRIIDKNIDDSKSYKLIVVSVGPFAGRPHKGIDNQYSILKIGYFDKSTGTRSLELTTRRFDAGVQEWKTAGRVAEGEFDLSWPTEEKE